jgi:hypothetical protein
MEVCFRRMRVRGCGFVEEDMGNERSILIIPCQGAFGRDLVAAGILADISA